MSEIRELGRRTSFHVDDAGSAAIVAEIVVEAKGRMVYLHGEWVDIVREFSCWASSESLFDVYEKLNGEGGEALEAWAITERNRIFRAPITEDSEFWPFRDELEQMIRDEMNARGIE